MKTIRGKILLCFATLTVVLLIIMAMVILRMICNSVVPLIEDSGQQIVTELSRKILLLIACTLIAIILLVYLLSHYITRPLSYAIKHIKAIADGDFSRQIPPKYLQDVHEMGDLSRGIDTMQKSLESLMKESGYLAYHDDLTGLHNRNKFLETLYTSQSQADKTNEKFGVLMVDIDNFKNINDTMGHAFGDLLLKIISGLLKKSLSSNESNSQLYRYGGDEFLVLVYNISDDGDLEEMAEQIFSIFQPPICVSNQEFYVSISVGGTIYPDHGDVDVLMRNANMAMHMAKKDGKSRYCLFETQINNNIVKRLEMEKNLRKAIENKEFFLCYQPLIDTRTGQITSVEALIRWRHPLEGVISPMDFIPIAEETGMIEQIGDWVLYEACRQNKQWQEEGLPAFNISVNVSIKQLQKPDFIDNIKDILHRTGLSSKYLEVEITESLFMKYLSTFSQQLEELKTLGVKISLDDFGTGYSSLSYLKNLPINILKIDRSFVSEIETDKEKAITGAIIMLGHQLNMEVVAEGVETSVQYEFLSSQGCDTLQGYLFSRPLVAEDFKLLIQNGNFMWKN